MLRIGTLPSRCRMLGVLPWHRDDRFPRSLQQPGPSSRRLCAGRRLDSRQVVPPHSFPGSKRSPGFDVVTDSRHLIGGSSLRLLGPHLTPLGRLFHGRSPPPALDRSSRVGLEPPPAGRLRGRPPSSAGWQGIQRRLSTSRRSSCLRGTRWLSAWLSRQGLGRFGPRLPERSTAPLIANVGVVCLN